MLINNRLSFIHCDFSFYLLTSYLDKKIRYIKSIYTLKSDNYSPISNLSLTNGSGLFL